MHRDAKVAESNEKRRQAWRRFHDTLKDNADEVVAGFVDSYGPTMQHVGAASLNHVVVLLRQLDRNAEADALVDRYGEAHAGNVRAFDIESQREYGEAIDDPRLVRVMAEQHALCLGTVDPIGTLIHLDKMGGNRQDYEVAVTATVPELARSRKHSQDNPEMSEARAALRRERLSEAGPEATDAEKAAMKRALGGCCRYCSVAFEGTEELDHLTPIARGGTNDIGNLTYACHACNRAKGSKSLTEFMVFRVRRRLSVRTDVPTGENPSPVTRANIRDSKRTG